MIKVKVTVQSNFFSERIRCQDGYFGEVCEQNCSKNCKTKGCDIINGSCECKVGYAGDPCTECPSNCSNGCNDAFHCYTCNPGFYGDFCNQTCSVHCARNRCGRDGRCQCKVGYGGHPCEPCPANCDRTGCDKQLICHECDGGFYGDYCNLTCSTNCTNGTCNRDGSCYCKKGFDGFGCCLENCEGGCNDKTFVCPSCKEGYYGDLCYETCPVNCLGACSRDGHRCRGCKDGHWGSTCQYECPQECIADCNQDIGSCRCTNGLKGKQCQESMKKTTRLNSE